MTATMSVELDCMGGSGSVPVCACIAGAANASRSANRVRRRLSFCNTVISFGARIALRGDYGRIVMPQSDVNHSWRKRHGDTAIVCKVLLAHWIRTVPSKAQKKQRITLMLRIRHSLVHRNRLRLNLQQELSPLKFQRHSASHGSQQPCDGRK